MVGVCAPNHPLAFKQTNKKLAQVVVKQIEEKAQEDPGFAAAAFPRQAGGGSKRRFSFGQSGSVMRGVRAAQAGHFSGEATRPPTKHFNHTKSLLRGHT